MKLCIIKRRRKQEAFTCALDEMDKVQIYGQ